MQIRCPHCHAPFESAGDPSWTDIICPSCDHSFSMLGAASTCTYRSGVKLLGRFALMHEVGSGRFGSVWKAHDTRLQRTVAIKIPRQRNLTEQETELFLRDARAAAQLHHSGIAAVHEVGRDDDTLYIVTDFIDGANLNEWLVGKRVNTLEAAALVRKVAEALHHAHNAGVIHRDVKPGNIMLDRNGEPYVIDFGLARREVGEITMTTEGQILGTPAYMSPEQACGEGHQADRRSDIYSLGVVLFKLLTGELPFRGEIRMLLLQIVNDEPPSPRTLNTNVPLDLETITLKCLEKEPAKRYQTARDLAEDLTRYLVGKPISARPVGRIERAWRWCKRHPELAFVSTVLLLVLVVISIVAPIAAMRESHLRRESEARSKELQNQVGQNLFQRASEESDNGRKAAGIALLAAAYKLVDLDSPLNDSIRSLMPGWATESGQPLVHNGTVLAVVYSPDGQTAVTAGHDHAAHVWDLRTMMPIGQPLKHSDSVRALALSPTGSFVLTGSQDGSGRFWNLKTGICDVEPLQHSNQVWSVAYSPDGKTAVTAGTDETVGLWNAATGVSLGSRLRHPRSVLSVSFSPNGQKLLTGCFDGTARIWDVRTKALTPGVIRVGTPIYAVAFSPDGRKLLTGSANRGAELWDAETLQPVGEALHGEQSVFAVAWSPDGREILTGSFDKTARLWNAETHKQIGEPLRHGGWVMAAAFSPNGRDVLTGSADRTARLWHVGARGASITDKEAKATAVSFEARNVFTAITVQTVQLSNPQAGVILSVPLLFDPSKNIMAASPDGAIVVMQQSARSALIWNVKTKKVHGEPIQDDSKILAAAFDGDGRILVTGGRDQFLRLWDVESGRAIRRPIRQGGIVQAVAFSQSGKWVVSGSSDQTASIWDAQTGAPVGAPMQHSSDVSKVAFSADDRLLLSVCGDGTAYLWEVGSCKLIARPLQYDIAADGAKMKISDGLFDFDGSTVQFQCADGAVRLYSIPKQLPNKPDVIRAWALAHCGLESDDAGNPRALSRAEWLDARRELQSPRNSQ